MARNSFARTVVITKCDAEWFDENNEYQKGEIELYGDYDINTAQNAVKKQLNAKGAIVKKVRHTSFYGIMPMKDFAKYCEKKNYKEW